MKSLPAPAKSTWTLLSDAWRVFSTRGGRVLSGALAFSALLSVVPFFVVAVRVAALVVGPTDAKLALHENVARWVGEPLARSIDAWLSDSNAASAGSSVLGVAALIYGSTRVFATITRAFDLLWAVDPMASSTLRQKLARVVERRVIGFVIVLGVGLLLVVMVFGHTVLGVARELSPIQLQPKVGEHEFPIGGALEYVTSYVATVGLFALLYKVLPSERVSARVALVSGATTAVLFTLGSLVLSAYIAHRGAGSSFGAATSAVLLLIWIYWAAHVFFFGAALAVVLDARK